jgi:ABC-type multidrug transport system fused ATPase/permease subunit
MAKSLITRPLHGVILARSFSMTPRGRFGQLLTVLSPEKKHLAGAVVAISATSAGTVSFPYFMGNMMDGFAASSSSPDLWIELVNANVVACVGALGLVGLGGFVRAYLLETASEKITRRLRLQLFESLLRKPMRFFYSSKTGDLVSRLGSDVTRVSRSVMDGASGLRVVINAAAGTMMVAKTVPLALVPQLLAPVILMFVGGVIYGRLVRGISKKQSEAQSVAMHVAEENLSLVSIVKLFNGESKSIQQYQKSLDKVYELAQANALATGGKVTAFVTIGGGFILHVVYQCGNLISGGTLTLGQTAALAGYLLVCGNAYQGLVTSYGDIQKALGACERVMDIMKEPGVEKVQNVLSAKPIVFAGGPPSIRLSEVSVGRHSANILNGVDMHVPGGARQAVVGLSGCGKSTILMLLSKLYEPKYGKIILNDDIDYSAIDGHQLRQDVVSMVPQDTALFNDTLMNNIWFPSDPLVDKEYLTSMARLNFVDEKSGGWDYVVGERGQNLSGGERQRVALARAIGKKKPVLLLDEATSALDTESDAVILKNLNSIPSTIVAVTHRRSTIEWSDRLTVLDEGKVVQEGDTQKLLRDPGPVLRRLLAQLDRSSP